MKSAIIYYSFSGNTRQVTNALAGFLEQKGEVTIFEIKALNESANFFIQCYRAFRKKRAVTAWVNYDLKDFDLVCFGTPVWAFGPAPAMNTYLDACPDIQDKSVLLFTTYGSGTGNTRCLDYMQGLLSKKGAGNFKRFSVQQGKVSSKEFVLSIIQELFL